MPRGVLFIGGRGPGPDIISRILSDGDLVCAADSGLDTALAAGVRPDGIVGDMDSLSDVHLLEGFPAGAVERYPEDKDDTDTDLGLAWLRRRGCDEIVLIGGGEGRLDHTLALLGIFGRDGAPGLWYTAMEEVRPLAGRMVVTGEPGEHLSVAAVGDGPWDIRSDGLHWPLDRVVWKRGGISLSNRLEGTEAVLTVVSGRFLCCRGIRMKGGGKP